MSWIDELFVPRSYRPSLPQAKATRGKPDTRSAGMDRLSNGQVVREPGFSRRRVRMMVRDWRIDVRAAAKRRVNKWRTLAGMGNVMEGGAE